MLDIDWMVTLMKVKEMPITEMMPARRHQVWHCLSLHHTVQQELSPHRPISLEHCAGSPVLL